MMHALAKFADRAYRVVFDSPPLPEPEPINARPRPMTGLLATLSAEQKAALLKYRGPENHGCETMKRVPA
ncbi:hypothetical protein MMB17_07285 [Methylobacterium organophilum]|uniref:hypothetical protein n=1 Tax=Methylobacterium organophilum TaxID=410 RepID=UPI001F1385BB|nr:hypothetical protein [Methylobacterium organophilum]UMY19093.1 hypothetical protein MMB17_07285 [Methylobacterium organophilum]